MSLLIEIRQAALRKEIDAQLFVQLAEQMLAQGQEQQLRQFLAHHGLLTHHLTVTGVRASELSGGTSSLDHSSAGGSFEHTGYSQTGTSQAGASLDSSMMEGSGPWGAGASQEGRERGWQGRHGVPQVLALNEDVIAISAQLAARSTGPSRAPDKYEVMEEIARGGVGAIHMVRDRDLMRRLVMKTLIEGNSVSPYVKAKFVEEAQITAQLEHPNIVPVHDFGYFSGGEIFFTMKLISGRTLREIVRGLRRDTGQMRAQFPLTRLLGVFVQVCQAIRFAHSRSVLHRDIKTSNVMVGDFGEVLVLDWGVAKVIGRSEGAQIGEDDVETLRSQSEDATMVGLVTGTPAYMSPEQAMGQVDTLDERSDIYALGALLYEILCWRAPFRGKDFRQILAQVLSDPPIPPSRRAPDNTIPLLLEQLCLHCMAKQPGQRPASVVEVIETVELYLAGVEDLDRRHRLSRTRYEEALNLVASHRQARAQVAQQREALVDLEWRLTGWAPIEHKRAIWAKQAQLQSLETLMRHSFFDAAQALMAAVSLDEGNQDAHNELARLHWSHYREALEAGDEPTAAESLRLVQAHNRGLFDDLLQAHGRLSLHAQPEGAQLAVARYREVDRQLVPERPVHISQSPLHQLKLDQGSYLITLRQPGFRDIQIPARIRQGEITQVSARFATEAQLGPQFVQVSAGPFVMGGDDACAAARHRRVIDVPEVWIARYPVTCAEYLAFLQDLDRIDRGRAQASVPRLQARSGPLWQRDAQGQIALPSADAEGYAWHPHWPVFGISFADALLFCRWYSQRAGFTVRLPTESEWEKSARGTDGRFYPWGDHFDAGFCHMAASKPGRAQPARVGQYPSDRSPYGLLDVAGLVREYTTPDGHPQGLAAPGQPPLVVVKGGAYSTTSDVGCRLSHRLFVPVDQPHLDYGFRLARSPEVGAAAPLPSGGGAAPQPTGAPTPRRTSLADVDQDRLFEDDDW